jgi:hypothetical protein
MGYNCEVVRQEDEQANRVLCMHNRSRSGICETC